jgi:hypothetical protein
LTGENVLRFKWPVRKLADDCEGPATLIDPILDGGGTSIGLVSEFTAVCEGGTTERLCAMLLYSSLGNTQGK